MVQPFSTRERMPTTALSSVLSTTVDPGLTIASVSFTPSSSAGGRKRGLVKTARLRSYRSNMGGCKGHSQTRSCQALCNPGHVPCLQATAGCA